ncbi:MAG: hypothetical protein RSD67_02455 [Oscillospiraceae bacterium]
MAGILYEIDPSITRSEQRSAINATADVDGGSPVIMGVPVVGDNSTFVATQATATSASVYIAYNPTFWYATDGTLVFPAVSVDPRNHTNIKGKPFGSFKPVVGQIFGVIAANITGSTAPTVGQFLEPTVGNQYAIKTAQTASVASFKVIEIRKQHFPSGNIGGEYIPVYVVETVFNV